MTLMDLLMAGFGIAVVACIVGVLLMLAGYVESSEGRSEFDDDAPDD